MSSILLAHFKTSNLERLFNSLHANKTGNFRKRVNFASTITLKSHAEYLIKFFLIFYTYKKKQFQIILFLFVDVVEFKVYLWDIAHNIHYSI